MTISISRRTAALAVAVLVTLAVLFGVSACSNKASQVTNDSGRTATQNSDPAQVIAMPDGFSNAASKCDGPNRIYTLFHNDGAYGAIAVVPNDPRCTGAKS